MEQARNLFCGEALEFSEEDSPTQNGKEDPGRLEDLILGFGVQGSGLRVQGSGFRVQGPGFKVKGLLGSRFRGSSFGL